MKVLLNMLSIIKRLAKIQSIRKNFLRELISVVKIWLGIHNSLEQNTTGCSIADNGDIYCEGVLCSHCPFNGLASIPNLKAFINELEREW